MDNQQGQGTPAQQPGTSNTPQPGQQYGRQVITPAQQTPSYAVTPYPQGGGSSVIYDSQQNATKNPMKRLIVLSACVLIIVVGVVFFISHEAQLSLLGSNYAYYTYVGKHGQDYDIDFYRGAAMQTQNENNTSALVASKVSSYPFPIALGIGGSKNDSTSKLQEYITESNNCTYDSGSTEAFHVYIASVGATANFCTDEGVRYVSFFGSGRSIYDIVIQENHPAIMTQSQITELLHNPLKESDLKKIAASFKPVS